MVFRNKYRFPPFKYFNEFIFHPWALSFRTSLQNKLAKNQLAEQALQNKHCKLKKTIIF